MGIYDREYYRDETGAGSWFSGVAPVTRTLMVVMGGIWLFQVLGGSIGLEEWFGLRSDDLFQKGQVWRLLTATFLHSPGNILHIFWNLLFLYWIGREMESMQGSREFLIFYLCSAIVSSLGWAITDRMLPGGRVGVMLGASGAITAVAVVFTLYYPNREVLLFFLPVRMWMLLAIYLGGDVLSLLRTVGSNGAAPTGQVAWASHLSGALFGLVYKVSGMRLSPWFSWAKRRPRLKIIAPDRREPAASHAAGRNAPARGSRPLGGPPINQETLEARVDEILGKIAREGRSSLTDEEKSILEEASRRARLRRSERL